VRRSLEVIYYCFWTNTPLNGSYTGLIMIVEIISENAILPIYSLKRHLLVRMIKKQSLVITSTRLRPKLMTVFSHYCIITFSDWNRYGFRVASTFSNCGNRVLIAMPLLLIVLPSLLYYFNIEQKE
jgi:hypothetical protein